MPQLVIGAIIGIGALVLALRGIDWNGVGNALRNTRPSMVLAALILTFVTLAVSTTRWWLLFTPEHRERNWWVLAGAIMIGQTANVVLPGRVGEIARMVLVGTRERVSKARVGATIVVEKVTDLAVFAVCAGFVLVAMSLPSWMMRSGEAVTVTSAMLVVLILSLSFWGGALLRLIEAVAKHLPARWGRRLVALSEAALDGLRSLRDWRAGLAIWFLAAVILLFSILVNYLLFLAMGLPLSPVAAVFLTVVLRIGAAPPSLPGKVGLLQYLVILALGVFGVDRTAALTYSFVMYAVGTLPVLIAGVACLFVFRWSEPQCVSG